MEASAHADALWGALLLEGTALQQPDRVAMNTTKTLIPDKKYRIPHLLLKKRRRPARRQRRAATVS